MHTIELNIDETLLAEINQVTQSLSMTLTDFARIAFELALRNHKIISLEQQHASGYVQSPVQPGEFDGWESEQLWSEP
jgi:hypothetical protein